MVQFETLRQHVRAAARNNAGLALIAAGSFALLLLPDTIFHLYGYQAAAVGKRESVLLAALVAVGATLVATPRRRMLVVGALLASQALWFGCLAYFGRPLGPEQLLLATNEAADVTAGIIDGWQVLLPPLLTIAATGTALLLLQRRTVGAGSLRDFIGGRLFVLTVVLLAGYWLTHRNVVVSIPGAHTFSALGPYQAGVSAVRLLLTPVAPAPGMIVTDQTITPLAIEEEPLTVVVVMGEGISPWRLSLFGHASDTSPRLAQWRTEPPAGFELIARIGFSGGVATFGSVPSFLKMAYWPVEAEWRGVNLFDLAHRSGFKSWFLSAQSRHFLDAAGGARQAVRVVAEQGNEARLAEKHDDFLVDLAREIPLQPARRFVVFHQRVNHSKYTSHCSHLTSDEQRRLYIFEAEGRSRESLRSTAYDNGLRCWDRNVEQLASAFAGAAGAVHIFITADHSEMMGEAGMWGHSMPDLQVAQVPMLLLTNRPQSAIATRFRKMSPPSWYALSQIVAEALGHTVETPGARPDRFYLNTTMPFGRSGYFEVEPLSASSFRVRRYSREGQRQGADTTIELLVLGAANAAAANGSTRSTQ
ncbi:MAG: sulfatase-like hydrolase/transferase [Hyphomicrobium sp.]